MNFQIVRIGTIKDRDEKVTKSVCDEMGCGEKVCAKTVATK